MSRSHDPSPPRRAGVRRRALAAARAATLGLGLASLGCGEAVKPPTQDLAMSRDLLLPDLAAAPDLAAGVDAPMPQDAAEDGAVDLARRDGSRDASADAGRDGAAGDMAGFDGVCPPGASAGTDPDCCVMSGGIWINGGCAIPGPFVPPAMVGEPVALV